VPRLAEAGLGVWGVAFSLALALAAGFASASVAAAQASRSDLAAHLNAAGRGLKGGPAGTWLRRTLAVSEIALSLLLLIGAGLLLKSLASLQEVDLGFDPSGVLTVQLELPEPRYPEDHQPPAFYTGLYERLGALPGVEGAGGIFLPPLSGMNASARFVIEGRLQAEGEPQWSASLRPVSPDYFSTLRIPLRRGRFFNSGDRAGAKPVLVVNEAAARMFWPGEDPVSRRVVLGADFGTTGTLEEAAHEIVGVVGDVRQAGPAQEEVPALYFPHLQSSWRMMTLVVRSSSDLTRLVPPVRREVWALDRDLPISEVKTMDQMLAESLSQSRFYALLVGSFAVLALILSWVGVYGVVACSVGERTHEIGVRMALGAGRGTVVRLVLKEALSLALAGVALGLGAATLLTRFLSSLLFGVVATDKTLFLTASLALVVAALAASCLPVRRALRLTPMTVLRNDAVPSRDLTWQLEQI
jgi:putative ABC transport system permease protein